MNEPTSRLATLFNKWREIIESAEDPFSKFAIFILPIIAPIVPASLTGLHLYKLFLIIFAFDWAWVICIILALLVALVLELLGYVGAISFIQAIFRLVSTRNSLYILPTILNGFAYLFYLALMFLVNYKLGEYFKTPNIINTVVGILSFVTVPTGLLAANYLSQKEIKQDEKDIRKEGREERLERARIRAGKVSGNLPSGVETYQKVVGNLPTDEKVSTNLSTDWRKIYPTLTPAQVTFLANSEPSHIVKELSKSGINISPRTASNWRGNARKVLRLD